MIRMKFHLVLVIAILLHLEVIGQKGFTSKAEAKNELKNNVKEGKWLNI
jgi:hypothetical protein